jgi:hypothetical protein
MSLARGGIAIVKPFMACYRDSGSTNIVNTADTTIDLDTEILDPDGMFSVSSGVITVKAAGHYSIAYSVPINDDGDTGATRCRAYAWVERNTGGGYSAIAQSRSQDYCRETSGGDGLAASFNAQLTAGDLIRLQIRSSANTDISSESGEATLSLFRIRK